MPKPPKDFDVNTGLMTFMLLNDVPDWINNPREWIDKSFLADVAQKIANEKASGTLLSQMSEEKFGLHYGRKGHESQMQSIAAQIKADKNLPKRIWANVYYQHHQKNNPYITKEEVAIKIRELLIEFFPEDAPTGKAIGGGQIPNVTTIRTKWLKEEVQKVKRS
jgi:hypothetical protein